MSTPSSLKRLTAALASRKAAAYHALVIMALGPITRLLDKLFVPGPLHEVSTPGFIFIVGNSRSGTSIFYQLATRFIPCVYPSNFHILAPKLATRRRQNNPNWFPARISLSNFYGYAAGLTGVSEANEYFKPLFADNPSPEELRTRLHDLAKRFGAYSKRPLMVKSIFLGSQLEALAKAVPEAIIVKLDRANLPMIKSVVQAYDDLGYINYPVPELDQYQEADIDTQATIQVLGRDHAIEAALTHWPAEQVIRIAYEELCATPETWLKKVAHAAGRELKHTERLATVKLRASQGKRWPEEREQRIQQLIGTWTNS